MIIAKEARKNAEIIMEIRHKNLVKEVENYIAEKIEPQIISQSKAGYLNITIVPPKEFSNSHLRLLKSLLTDAGYNCWTNGKSIGISW